MGVGAAATWVLFVGLGVRSIFAYTGTAGAVADAPATWPASTALARAADGATVLMFVHPDCPCTRASLHELAELERDAPKGTTFSIVDDIHEAARFGARTSGHVVVYDRRGILRFSGGITGARGHQGNNVGRETVAAVLRGEAPAHSDHAVFGCALEGPR